MALGTARISKQLWFETDPFTKLSSTYFCSTLSTSWCLHFRTKVSDLFFFPLQDLKETSLAGPAGQNVFINALKNLITKISVRFTFSRIRM